MLGKNPELQIVGEASDGSEAVHKAEELQPDLIVLDIGLPTLNGIEVDRRIRKTCPRVQNTVSEPGILRRCIARSAQFGGTRVRR